MNQGQEVEMPSRISTAEVKSPNNPSTSNSESSGSEQSGPPSDQGKQRSNLERIESWKPRQVCRWAQDNGLSIAVVAYLREVNITGRQLIHLEVDTLRKAGISEEIANQTCEAVSNLLERSTVSMSEEAGAVSIAHEVTERYAVKQWTRQLVVEWATLNPRLKQATVNKLSQAGFTGQDLLQATKEELMDAGLSEPNSEIILNEMQQLRRSGYGGDELKPAERRSRDELPIESWDEQHLAHWLQEDTDLGENTVSTLKEHDFRGKDLLHTDAKQLVGYNLEEEEAQRLVDAIDRLVEKHEAEGPEPEGYFTEENAKQIQKARRAGQWDRRVKRRKQYEADKSQEHPKRQGRWGSSIEFTFSLISTAVGLGNIWRFPYQVYTNGGGTFIFIYLFGLVFLGFPLFYMEIGIGQLFQHSPLRLWGNISPCFQGVGVSAVLLSLIVSLYYIVIVAWSLLYLVRSFEDPLPYGEQPQSYFFQTALRVSENAGTITEMNWELFFSLAVGWLAIFFITFRGARSTGKASYFTALFPYVVLLLMFGRAVTLDGAADGVEFFVKPDAAKFADLNVWIAAISQMFYSLSLGWGALISFSAFNPRDHNFQWDAVVVVVTNVLTSLLAGFTIFAIIGFVAAQQNATVDDVIASGSGLIFIVIPQALVEYPVSQLFGVLFFFMVAVLGIGSQFAMFTVVRSSVLSSERLGWLNSRLSPAQVTGVLCTVCFGLGLLFVTDAGFYLLNLVDTFSATLALLVVAVGETYVVLHEYGADEFFGQCEQMLGHPVPAYIRWTLQYSAPTLLMLLLIGTIYNLPTGDYERLGCLDGARTDNASLCNEIGWFSPVGFVLSLLPTLPMWYYMVVNWSATPRDIKSAQAKEHKREDLVDEEEEAVIHRFDTRHGERQDAFKRAQARHAEETQSKAQSNQYSSQDDMSKASARKSHTAASSNRLSEQTPSRNNSQK